MADATDVERGVAAWAAGAAAVAAGATAGATAGAATTVASAARIKVRIESRPAEGQVRRGSSPQRVKSAERQVRRGSSPQRVKSSGLLVVSDRFDRPEAGVKDALSSWTRVATFPQEEGAEPYADALWD